ncbi:sensor histidine kinase [Pedobacter alpinus]|uniref:histidine kinase n=1 Tax=Pedobacter alpinus TaxID=1590643 RepID=A0ABW5TWA6_9SPHI
MKYLKLKIIISVYVCLIILAVYNSFHNYNNDINSAKQEVFTKLSTVSSIIASQLDGDKHEKIINSFPNTDDINTNTQNKDYSEINKQLATIKKSSGINTDIYTLVPTQDIKKFYFGISSSDKPYYKHLYHTPPKELIDNYKKGGVIDEYNDENGIWLSAFTPVKNSNNEVVAVVQIDKNFEEFKDDIFHDLINNILLVIVFYAFIGVLLYLFLKSLLIKEENYNKAQNEYTDILAKEVELRTKELSLINKKLNKVNKELESFFYSTSHDIRGPLCRILGLSSLAKIETDKQELVEMIEIESQKMDEMLKKMILVNNIRTKDLKIVSIDVNNRLNEILSGINNKYKLDKHDVIVKTQSQSLNNFNCDIELFDSIVINLLDNAFKFSKPGNPIVKINSFIDQSGILSLSVINNGKSFSEIEKDNAFELFKRANKQGDMDTIRLGLYSIKTALDRINGLIDIYPKNNLTEIRVMIPNSNASEAINELILKQKISLS